MASFQSELRSDVGRTLSDLQDTFNESESFIPSSLEAQEALLSQKAPARNAMKTSKSNPSQGQLIFNSSFECGNLESAMGISDHVYELRIRPDTNNPKYRVWFYFEVSNYTRGQRVCFNVTNFSKTKSLYRNGMTPLVLVPSSTSWERVPQRSCFYYRSPRHNMAYVLSFIFTFETDAGPHLFSYSFPYTYTKLQHFLHLLEMKQMPFLRRTMLTRTLQGRRLDCLTITQAGPVIGGGKKKVVFVTARVHPGESPSSYVMHGFIDYLTSSLDPVADILRHFVEFKLVPMLNPDGVFAGNYRCSPLGQDLNRQWLHAENWNSPELAAVKNELASVATNPKKELCAFIDLHAHSTNMNAFCFANIPSDDPAEIEREVAYLKLLDVTCKEFSLQSSKFCKDPSKVGTGRRALHSLLSEQGACCYTLEVSFYAYHSFGSQPLPFSDASYQDVGRALARTFSDYFKLPKPFSREGQAVLKTLN